MTTHYSFVLTADPRWLLTFEGFDPEREPQIEAVCALVNGYQGTRAALEEGYPTSRPATFIAGVFNTPAAPQAAELEEPIPELVVAPDWSRLRLVAGGVELRLDSCELLEHRRTLDMRQGTLLREWRLRDGQGRVTRLSSLRFASLAGHGGLLGQRLQITPENYSAPLELELLVDARVTNENNTRHLDPARFDVVDAGTLIAVRTQQSGYTIAMASSAQLDEGSNLEVTFVKEGAGAIRERYRWQGALGRTDTVEKLVGVASSRDAHGEQTAERLAAARLAEGVKAGFAAALAGHTAAWAARWESADAVIPGDGELQRQARFAIYHLIGAAHPGDEHSSIGARALTGERYRGHVFWDTEVFAWPPTPRPGPSAGPRATPRSPATPSCSARPASRSTTWPAPPRPTTSAAALAPAPSPASATAATSSGTPRSSPGPRCSTPTPPPPAPC